MNRCQLLWQVFKQTSSATLFSAALCLSHLPLFSTQMYKAKHVSASLQTFSNCKHLPTASHICTATISSGGTAIMLVPPSSGCDTDSRHCDDSRSMELTPCFRESPVNSVIVFTFIHQASACGNTSSPIQYGWSKHLYLDHQAWFICVGVRLPASSFPLSHLPEFIGKLVLILCTPM